ncbi:MAG: hypothetical protein KC917_21950, partial [Candidatus Omnitrophica bacterium]|nr:hypothetical protein [Candidatus Omnitrophota bacterium]
MYELFIQGAIELMQSGLLNPFILLSVLVGVSSAHLFGFEFSEGAGGFIQTRPISHRQLFFIKTSILVVLCGILGVLTKMVCRIPSGIHIEFVFAALYLDIAFWIATCTLLCRETVRGLLYGVPTLLLASSAIVYGFLRYSMDAIYVSGEETPLLQENLVALPVGLIGILVSPVVVLGLLSIAAHRWRFGTWRVTPISIIAIVSFGVLAHYSFAQEGKVVIPNQIKSSQLRAFQETEDRFYFLELSSSRDKTRHTIQINKVDWTDPGSGIQRVLEIPLELDFDSLPEAAQGILSKATSDTHPLNYIHLWMNHNRVFAGTYIEKQ